MVNTGTIDYRYAPPTTVAIGPLLGMDINTSNDFWVEGLPGTPFTVSHTGSGFMTASPGGTSTSPPNTTFSNAISNILVNGEFRTYSSSVTGAVSSLTPRAIAFENAVNCR
jgi:hypothetical protein